MMLVAPVAPRPVAKATAAQRRKAVVRAKTSSGSVEWYTPRFIIEAARSVLGDIDLDPASCAEANVVVRARIYYVKADDGFSKPWRGRVWLNPPYGVRNRRSNQDVWTARLFRLYDEGKVAAGLALVNAETGSKWFEPLWQRWVCLLYRRVHFWTSGEEKSQPTHSNAVIYAGPDPERFAQVFSRFGRVIPPLPVQGQGQLL